MTHKKTTASSAEALWNEGRRSASVAWQASVDQAADQPFCWTACSVIVEARA